MKIELASLVVEGFLLEALGLDGYFVEDVVVELSFLSIKTQ